MDDDIILGRVTPDWKKCVEMDNEIFRDKFDQMDERISDLEDAIISLQKEIDNLQGYDA